MVLLRDRLGMSCVPSLILLVSHSSNITRSTASVILSAVKNTLSALGAPTITVVGQSLGAALALLDAVYFHVQLGSSVNVQVVNYGIPCVVSGPVCGLILFFSVLTRAGVTSHCRPRQPFQTM